MGEGGNQTSTQRQQKAYALQTIWPGKQLAGGPPETWEGHAEGSKELMLHAGERRELSQCALPRQGTEQNTFSRELDSPKRKTPKVLDLRVS